MLGPSRPPAVMGAVDSCLSAAHGWANEEPYYRGPAVENWNAESGHFAAVSERPRLPMSCWQGRGGVRAGPRAGLGAVSQQLAGR